MANELENQGFNFSIENTMEMGLGNQTLLNDLLAPETVTSKTEEIEVISDKPKTKEKPISETKKKEESSKEEPKDKALKSFLTDDEEEGEEEEETPKNKEKASKKEDESEEEEEEETSESENKFSALAKDLFKLGVFSKGEDEDDVEIASPQDFLDRFNLEKKRGAIEVVDKFLNQFGEEYQEAFDAIFVKGVHPKEYFGTYNSISDFSSLDLKDEGNQEALVKQGLIEMGLEPEDVKAKLEKIKNYGDLEDEAQRFHKILIKKEAAKLEQLKRDSEAKLQQQAAVRSQYIKNVNTVLQDKLKVKEFDGIPLNPKLAAELQDFLVTDKYQTPTGEKLTEFDRAILDLKRPENHEKKVKLALLLKVLEKDPTLSTIQKAGVTKKTDTLFGELARHSGKSSVKSEKKEQPKSWFV